MSQVNHSNWRQRAILDLQKADETGVHYTSVFAVSRADAERMKELIAATTMRQRKMIPASPEEDLYCFLTDFFRI